MSDMVTLTIDGKQVQAPPGMLIVDAAKKIGIDIPVFCYHPKLEPVGMCRMCLVEIGRPLVDRATGQFVLDTDGNPKVQFGPKLETACTVPVSEGMVVIGLSENVKAARKDVLEFLLTSHPLDCPVCDKGGECPLQDLTMHHGPGVSRFIYDEKMRLAKHLPLGELIVLDRERCIQCARCVRFQEEVVDDPVIGFYNRGRALEIATSSEPGFDSYFSGNTTDICPVGALTTVDFRFGARPWELTAAASICSHCPVGCNITFNVRREARSGGQIVIKRVLPRQNEAVNEVWMCDKGRLAYHYTESEERLDQPLIRKDGELKPMTWDEALDLVAVRFREAGSGLLSIASGRLSNEDLFNLRQMTEGLGGKVVLDTHMAGGDLVAQVGVGQGSNLADLGKGSAILVVACDLEEEAPIWWLRVKQAADRGATLIVANPRPTKTERYAKHVVRYRYGEEAATVLGMVNALSPKRPDLPGRPERRPELQAAAQAFLEAENAIVLYGSEGTWLEASRALAQACANLLLVTQHVGRPNNGLIGVWQRANDQGAWDMGLRPAADLNSALREAKALYIVASNPAGDSPDLNEALQTANFLVVQELFLTETARLADVVLPALAYPEREGSYTSGERRVQRFYPALAPRMQPRPDFAISAAIGKRLGVELEAGIAARVMGHIATQTPDYAGINYRRLAEVIKQWPIVGNGDRYYGGTAIENTQGLGVQLTPAAQRGENISLSWPRLEEQAPPEGKLVAVPITLLYDQGQTVMPSKLLHQRIPVPYIVAHSEDAKNLDVGPKTTVLLCLDGLEMPVLIRLDDNIPPGFVLVPRSMGIPVNAPLPVEIRVVETTKA